MSTQALLLGETNGSTGGLHDLDVDFGASSGGGRARGNPDDSDDDDAIARLFSIGGLKRRRSSDSHHQDGGGGSVRPTLSRVQCSRDSFSCLPRVRREFAVLVWRAVCLGRTSLPPRRDTV